MLADGNALSVRVNQHFVAVKAIAVVRLTRTIDAISVELSGYDAGHKDMPVMRSTVDLRTELYDSVRLLGFGMIKQYDLDSCGMRRENAEIRTIWS